VNGTSITSDVFLAKYSPTGAYLWAKGFSGLGSEIASGVATDASGNVAITGYFAYWLNLGGTQLTSVTAGINNVFVGKYSSSGAHLWSESFGGSDTDQGFAITADSTGHVVVSGGFYGVANFGGQSLTSTGSSDAFLLRLDP